MRRLAIAWLAVSCAAPPPTLQRVEPARGLNDRAVPVVLHGQGFEPRFEERGSDVVAGELSGEVGGQPLGAVTWRSATRIEAVVPIGVPMGALDVVVRGAGWQAVLASAFTSLPAIAPRLDSAVPEELPQSGGAVSLSGTGLFLGSEVSIGGTRVPARWIDDYTLVIDAPPGLQGWVDVEVFTPVGSAARTDLLRYRP